MDIEESKILLDQFRRLPAETEWLEFKEAKNDFTFDKLGKYFSALSNEANLKGKDFGWLIFGVRDSDKAIIGTNYRTDRRSLDKLKGEISEHTTSRIGFTEIFDLKLAEGRVLIVSDSKGCSWNSYRMARTCIWSR